MVEGVVSVYDLHFRVIFDEFIQTYEGTRNYMSPGIIDTTALGLNDNLQGRIRSFSLSIGREFQRKWKDVDFCKIHASAMPRMNFM